ncbi:ModD protein [Hyphomicrobium methylovorum]|nr:ModD protein [Hyphomicrobium methylovorum]
MRQLQNSLNEQKFLDLRSTNLLSGTSRAELESLLYDDVPNGDLTTEGLGLARIAGKMTFTARDEMVLAEVESAAALLEMAGCHVSLDVQSGNRIAAGQTILTAQGKGGSLFAASKVAQTLIETWSGVATAARAIVDAAQEASPRIIVGCTRKHVPGTKSFAVRAVRAGGATMHRLGLSETVLVFAQHRAFLHDEPLSALVERLRRAAPEQKLIIEVTSLDEARAAREAGFDVIQIDKLKPEAVAQIVSAIGAGTPRPMISATGGINVGNAGAYAKTGVDMLVTSAPYFGRPCDVKVDIRPA